MKISEVMFLDVCDSSGLCMNRKSLMFGVTFKKSVNLLDISAWISLLLKLFTSVLVCAEILPVDEVFAGHSSLCEKCEKKFDT